LTHTLTELGLRPERTDRLPPLEPGTFLARVVADHGVRVHVLSPRGRELAWLPPTTHLAADGPDRPAIGDWVVAREVPGEPSLSIVGLLPRVTELVRQKSGLATQRQVIAANIDRVLVVVSMNKDLSVNRVERLIAAVSAGGAEPIVVVHKADLDPGGERATRARLGVVGDLVPVLFTSVVLPGGLEPLDPYLGPGVTLALIGSSGVGKSTLVNHLLGEETQVTQSQRLQDDRGRHTTTARSLFVLSGGRGVLIDTPGMRELALWSAAGLGEAFADVQTLLGRCRYRSCAHEGEDGCAVQEALSDGRLDPRRWENHRKLTREAEWLEQRKTGAARARGRAFSKHVRSLKKDAW
jgi:ribosome biogenesis GTPase